MKKYLTIALSLVLLCSCSNASVITESDTTEAASSSSDTESETAAESELETATETESETVYETLVVEVFDVHHLQNYHLACSGLLNIEENDEQHTRYMDWVKKLPQMRCCDGDFLAAENIYNFIHDFSISRAYYEEYLYIEGAYYTYYVDLDILYNGTAEEVEEAFRLENFEQWLDGHIEKENTIKWTLRDLVCATEDGKKAWFAWQEEKGYTDDYVLPSGATKSEYMPNTWFSLTELVHRFDISRSDFASAVEQRGKFNGTTFDIDRIFDGYEELMRLQEEEDLYPVEVDRLCWTGPAWAPGSMDDGSPDQSENPPDDPDTPVETTPAEDVETVPGAGGEPVRGIDVETVPS